MTDECDEIPLIIQGENRSIPLSLDDGKGGAVTLVSATKLDVFLRQDDDTFLAFDMLGNITSAAAGEFNLVLTTAQTTLLKTGRDQSLEVEFTVGAETRITQKINAYDVEPRLA